MEHFWNQLELWSKQLTCHSWQKVSVVLSLFGFMLAFSAVNRKSVTVDEFQALPSGLAMWKTGDFRYPVGTPPLSQLLPTIPLLFHTSALVKPVEGPSANWAVAHQFAYDNREKFHDYFYLGRLMSGLVFAITLALTYALARSLYGEPGAALALFCACFNPILLGHSFLITPDIYLACSIVGFLYAIELFRRRPGFREACLVGLLIGIA